MKIYHNDTEILDIAVDDSSYRYRAIKGDHNITLYFSLAEHAEIPVGSFCVYQNETYTLEKPESLKMKHSRNFEYTVIFESPQAKAQRFKFRNPVDGRLKFSLTAKPIEHLQMFVDNMNQRDSGWSVGQCIDAPEITLSYNHVFCNEALTQMADELETEYEIVGKQVSLWKVEYNRDNPLPLSYGRGNGFKPGIGRSNYEDKVPIEILYTQGGDRNIDASKYGSSELLLPKSQQIRFDGVHFEDETGYDVTKARVYVTDADGFSIQREDKALTSQAEDSLDCSEIYPSRIGTVTSVEIVQEGGEDQYNFFDTSIPDALDYKLFRIKGESATIIFQSGELSGREFEIMQSETSITGYDHTLRRFKLVKQEIDGVTMPGGVYIPRVGDTYAVFGIMLPDAYICDNATKSGASWDMFREGVKYLYDNEGQKFTFTGELDGIWAKQDWLNIGGKIKLGGFVLFTDERFQQEGVLVRIIGIKDYINNPHSPEIELSNSTVGRSVSSDLRQIGSNEVLTEDLHKEAIQFTKRRYRDAKETIEMLGEALLDNFTNSINPITVQTMAMLVGDESLQFRFVNSKTNPTPVAHNVVYDTTTKVLSSPAGIIQHLTLGITTISSSHEANEYKCWAMSAFESPTLTDGSKKYYLYAKVSKTAQTGVFYMSETAVGIDEVSGYYHLLMGVLNSEFEGVRSYASLYGFTEVMPGRITTDKIVSPDGLSYFDLLGNSARMGGGSASPYVEWNKNSDGKMRIHGAINVDGGGAEFPALVPRGVYSSTANYYWGDIVTCQGSTYLCIYELGSVKNKLPTNTTYWRLWVSKGEDAEPIRVQYSANGTSWHDTYQNGDEYMRIYSQGSWGSAVKIKGEQGLIGPDGRKAPYHDFMFGISAYTSASGAPSDISSWSDTPPATTSSKPYLWYRDRYYTVNSSNEWVLSSTSYYRLTGVKGSDGANGNLTKHQWAKTLTTTQPAESEWKNDFSQVADHSGYYLWQRLLESLDGGVTWTVNTATVGIILDPTITKEEAEIQYALEEAARATVAEKLGYGSWESFSDAVAASQVIIQNGQINASLINTDLLIAKVVETSAALRRILIFNNEMNVIDDAENTVVRVHGGYNSSIYQFSNVSGSQSSVSFMPTQNTKQESSSFSVTTTYLGSKELYVGDREVTTQYTGNSFTISNSGVSKMSGRIKAYLTTDWSNLSGFSEYSFGWHYVEARFYLSRRSSYCDYSANLGSCYASANGPIYTTKYVDFNVNLDAGTYYVFVGITGSGSILELGMQDYRTKTYSGQLNASCQSQQNAAATVLLLQEKLEIFANGLGYRQSNNDYAVLLRTGSGRDASGYLQAEILSGVAGLRLGNNGSSSYLDAKLGKTWFSLVPKVMASWTWNGSSYVLQKWMVRGYNGSNTPYSIAVSDGVNFDLPSDYSGEQFSNSDIYIATAWSTESSRKDTAFVYKVNATQLIIKIDKMGGGMERVNVSLIVW